MTKTVVASYVSDFLKSDMLHVYRQIEGQNSVEPFVLTHKLENESLFPFPKTQKVLLPKSPFRWFRKIYYKHWKKSPWQLFDYEVKEALFSLKRTHSELLHVYFGHSALHMLKLIKSFPGPVVVSFHGADAGVDMKDPERLKLMKEVFQHAAQIQARSESLASDLERMGCPKEKLRIQRTGIPLEDWTYQERKHPSQGEWKFFQSCRFIEKKGLDTAIRAFAKIAVNYPNATFEIAGNGPFMEPLKQLVQELKLEKSVHFLGFLKQTDLHLKVQQAHFFFHPSRLTSDGNREGVPNAMLEAMASGACVLATLHGGIPEAVNSGISGCLVPENDHDALAEVCLDLIKNPEKLTEFCRQARLTIEDKFNREKNLQVLQTSYLDLIEKYREHRNVKTTAESKV